MTVDLKNWKELCEEKDKRIKELEGKFGEIVEALEEERDDCIRCDGLNEEYYFGKMQGFEHAIEICKEVGGLDG